MKNQYFADERDYLKYDLLQETTEKMGGIERLTLIPMLTKSDNTGQGNMRDYQKGKKRNDLYKFLKDCVNKQHFDIINLRSHFSNWEYEYCPYWDDKVFEHQYRDQYFKNIPGKLLNSAVVFLDPDTGLEKESRIKRSERDRNIKYTEVSDLFSKMRGSSVLVLYQHRPQGWTVDETFDIIKERLKNRVGISTVSMVSDGQICFFGMGKKTSQSGQMAKHWRRPFQILCKPPNRCRIRASVGGFNYGEAENYPRKKRTEKKAAGNVAGCRYQ